MADGGTAGVVHRLPVVSRNAGDVVHGFPLAMKLGATVDDLGQMHHAFPTFAEGIKAAR